MASASVWMVVVCACIAIHHNLFVIPVMSEVAGGASFQDQKNYYSPDPNIGTPPVPRVSPPRRTSPSPGYGSSPPYHVTPSHPSHSPPTSNCGNPPHVPTPSAPHHGGGGGSYYNPPASGGGSYGNPPPSGGGSYGNPPSSGGSTPQTPVIVSPPTTPTVVPGTPAAPTPPFFPDPNSNPFTGTCNYWRTHPTLVWGLLGWWGTLGSAFGVTSVPGFPSNLNPMQALSNNRNDGLGQLYREGTASLLNSMVNTKFPYTTQQVRNSFLAALHSNSAATAQARLFRLANEGHLKPRD